MSELQAITFDRKRYSTKDARLWLKKNGYNPIKRVHKTENLLRYRITEPEKYSHFITNATKWGINYTIGFLPKLSSYLSDKKVKQLHEQNYETKGVEVDGDVFVLKRKKKSKKSTK